MRRRHSQTEGRDVLSLDRLQTPIGECLLLTDPHGNLRALDWADYESRMRHLVRRQYHHAVIGNEIRAPEAIRRRLIAYFEGDLAAIEKITCRTEGTKFQRSVWQALRSIRVGETKTYGEIARQLSLPGGARAVGLANGSNPIGVVVPCHRVIGANGDLTDYGAGLRRKRWLLEHEGVWDCCVSRHSGARPLQ